MMNCEQIGNLLDNGEILELTPHQQGAVTEHLRGCERCNSEWRAVRALWEVATLPAPAPREGLFSEAMRLATTLAEYRGGTRAERSRPSFWLGAALGGALAAGLVIAVMGTLPRPETAPAAAPAITIALNEVRDVGVGIDSAQPLSGAEIRVVLTGGVRLAGFDDRSVVSWRTDLDQGVNRLTLPLVAVGPGSGQVLVEVEHASKRQIFVVDVGIDGSEESA